MSNELDLEEEIRLELERLQQIFCDESGCVADVATSLIKPNRVSYSAYEYAEAEGEKEELEDKLNLLLSKTEDFSAQMERMNNLNVDLQSRCTQLQFENARLKAKNDSKYLSGYDDVHSEVKGADCATGSPTDKQNVYSMISPSASIALEHLLVEERKKMAQLEACYRDTMLIKDSALLELERERGMRIHAGTKFLLFEVHSLMRIDFSIHELL